MDTLRMLGRNLVIDRNRSVLSGLAVAAAIVLIVVLEGFKVGLYRQIREYPQTLDVPLIATQAGVGNMTGARSIIPLSDAMAVGRVPGVGAVHPLVGVPLIYQRGDAKTPIYVVAYRGRGGPSRLVTGAMPAAEREAVVDQGLAKKYGIGVGDSIELAGWRFRVAGISGGSSNVFNPYVFVRLDDALALYASAPDHLTGGKMGVSFLLIETAPGASAEQVRAAIEDRVPGVDVLTPAELGENDVAMAGHLMGGVMSLLVTVAYIVGILVIGLTLYASVFERLREFGIMKAIGAPNRRLYRLVLAEAMLLVALGLVAGVVAGLGVAKLIGWAAPQYLVVPWSGAAIARTAVAAVVMAGVAALLPVRQVAHVDPVLVFRR